MVPRGGFEPPTQGFSISTFYQRCDQAELLAHLPRQRKNGPSCCNTDFRKKNVAKWWNPSRKRQIDKNYHVEHSKATQVIWYKASTKCYSYARGGY